MKHSIESNLGYIMKILGISGKELAQAVHVDVSLVSKWKKNKRKIISEAQYFNKLIHYIIQNNENDILEKHLIEYGYEINNEVDLFESLSKFIISAKFKFPDNALKKTFPLDSNVNAYDSVYRVYKDNEGRRLATIQFFDQVLSNPEPTELYIVSQENMYWIIEDPNYTLLWLSKITQMLDKGNHIKMIHIVDRDVAQISNVVTLWAKLYTRKNIESYYYAKYTDRDFWMSLFIDKRKSAVVGIQTDIGEINKRYTAYYKDEFTVSMYYDLFEQFYKNSKPLVQNYNSKQLCSVLNKLYTRKNTEGISLISKFPSYVHFSESQLREILERNNVAQRIVDQILKHHQVFSKAAEIKFQAIYALEEIERSIHQENYIIENLSCLSGKKIIIEKSDIVKLLMRIEEDSEKNKFEVILINNLENIHESLIDLKVAQGNFVMTNDLSASCQYSIVDESTTVASFKMAYDNIWNQIPRIQKDREYARKVIKKLREMIG